MCHPVMSLCFISLFFSRFPLHVFLSMSPLSVMSTNVSFPQLLCLFACSVSLPLPLSVSRSLPLPPGLVSLVVPMFLSLCSIICTQSVMSIPVCFLPRPLCQTYVSQSVSQCVSCFILTISSPVFSVCSSASSCQITPNSFLLCSPCFSTRTSGLVSVIVQMYCL